MQIYPKKNLSEFATVGFIKDHKQELVKKKTNQTLSDPHLLVVMPKVVLFAKR